jgi:hypothetical protein
MVQMNFLSRKNVLVLSGVVFGIVLLMLLRAWAHSRAASGGAKATVHAVKVEEVVAKDLAWANQLSGSGINRELMTPIHGLFIQGRKGSHDFADDVLGFRSKWYLTQDYLSKGHRHADFLREEFSKHIFSPQQLQKAIEAAVSAYMRHLEDVDSQLLVKLETDLSGVPAEQFSAAIDRRAIHKIVDEALRHAREASIADFKGTAGVQVAVFIAAEVLTAATVGLATSAGLLTAGAVSGVGTFMIGTAVAFAADYALTKVYDRLYDPVGQLSKRVSKQLDELERMVLFGNATRPGLVQRLHDYSMRRSQAREISIRSAILRPVVL